MTTLEFLCPRCGKHMVVSAQVPLIAWADPETTVLLYCNAEDCRWRGTLYLCEAKRLEPPLEQVEAAEDVG